MAFDLAAAAAAGQVALNAATGITGLVYGKQDRDYQKALQKTMFEREDTAVQRRMQDLQAAGLNPNLAAGSAAGAGSVVGRSETPRPDFGSLMDAARAAQTLRTEREQTKQKQLENHILETQKNVADWESLEKRINVLNNLGINYNVQFDYDNQKWQLYTMDGKYERKDMPQFKIFDLNREMLENSANLLQNDVDYYTADKALGYITSVLGAGANIKRAWR